MTTTLSFDQNADVLYVKRDGARIVDSEIDGDCIVNMDDHRRVVGVQLLCAIERGTGPRDALDRIPNDISERVRLWLDENAPPT